MVSCWILIYATCGGSCDKSWIESVMGKPRLDIKWQIKWLSVHEFARYTKIHIKYNILISRKLQYPARFWRCQCHNFYCMCFGVKLVFEVSRGFLYTESLAVNILQTVPLVCYIFKRLKMRKLKKNSKMKTECIKN